MGHAGEVIIYVFLLVIQGIVAFYVFSYAAHVFLTVVQDTAAGNDEVIWRDEPFIDRFWTTFFLAWVVLCSSAPAVVLVPIVHAVVRLDSSLWKTLVPEALVFWLIFPFCFLSTLSTGYWWGLIDPSLMRRGAKRTDSVASFYGLTALLGAGCVVIVGLMFSKGFQSIVLAAPLLAAAFLIYARLLGRLGDVLRRVTFKQARKRRSKKRTRVRSVETDDPWANSEPKRFARGPTIVHPLDGPVESYGLEEEVPPEDRTYRDDIIDGLPLPFDGPAEPYDVTQTEAPTLPEVKATKEEIDLITHEVPELARRSITSGIWTFPWYASNLKVWVWLSLGFLLMGTLFLIQGHFVGFMH